MTIATIITDLGLLYYKPSKKRIHYAIFECIHCSSHIKRKYSTKKPTCKSCMGKNAVKHGMWENNLYRIFTKMINRCYVDDGKSAKYYKDKGIKICDEWIGDFELFEKWANENGYKDGLSIERKDNALGYYPENCTWIETNKQPENRSKFCNNTSGYIGVSYQKSNGKYKSYASDNKKQYYIGMFKTAIEAAEKRDEFIKDRGLNLNLNFK